MSDFLEQLVAERREYVASASRRRPVDELIAGLPDNAWTAAHGALVGGRTIIGKNADAFSHALHAKKLRGELAVIAEVKRRSPALGELAAREFSPADQALAYVAGGAAAISVLTVPRHWHGSLDDLRAIREAVGVPIVCKDVIVDEYQIVEARAAGADAVLLIAEALTSDELVRFVGRAIQLSMGALVEAHEPVAFGRAVAAGAQVVGVNARDLRHPEVIDIGRVRQLHTFAREHQALVAESGIASADDARLLPERVDAVLIGTALMRATDAAPLIRAIAAVRRRSNTTAEEPVR